jgi:hypothetical protein
MSQRLEEFLRELPGKGVPENAVQLYRSVLEDFESFLGKAAQLRFSRYEINRFVTQRQRAGANERELKNIGTACAAYLTYCEALAPAPAVGTAGEKDEGPTSLPAAPPPQERRKVLLIIGAVGALLLSFVGGCIVDMARGARNERAFSDELFKVSSMTRGDRALLREQIQAAAQQHGVRIKSIATGLSPLTPANVNKLPMDQRMRAMAALQAQAQPRLPPPGVFGDAPSPRPRVIDEPLWYVEIEIVGEVKGLVSSHKVDFEIHALGGGAPHAPPPPSP